MATKKAYESLEDEKFANISMDCPTMDWDRGLCRISEDSCVKERCPFWYWKTVKV